MANNHPALWWQSAPVIKDGKVLCVAVGRDGEETTELFTLEELAAHLTQRAADARKAGAKKVISKSKVRVGRARE